MNHKNVDHSIQTTELETDMIFAIAASENHDGDPTRGTWLDLVIEESGMDPKVAGGVITSLQSKGLVRVYTLGPGMGQGTAVYMTDSGMALYESMTDSSDEYEDPDPVDPAAPANPAIKSADEYRNALATLLHDCGYERSNAVLVSSPSRIRSILGDPEYMPDAIVLCEVGSLDVVFVSEVQWDGHWFRLDFTPTEGVTAEPYNSYTVAFYRDDVDPERGPEIKSDEDYSERFREYREASQRLLDACRAGRHDDAARIARSIKPLEYALTRYDATNGRR